MIREFSHDQFNPSISETKLNEPDFKNLIIAEPPFLSFREIIESIG